MKKIIAVILTLAILAGGGIFLYRRLTETKTRVVNLESHEYSPRADLAASDTFDVIVFGTEPEGISAAVSAARNGASVLIVGEDSEVGGLMTLGRLNFIDMCHGRDKTLLTRGFFEEFYNAVGGSAYEIDHAIHFFRHSLYKYDSIVLKLDVELSGVVKQGRVLRGITLKENGEERTYYASRLIDASADADLAAMSGVRYTFGGEDLGEKDRMMGVTLVFEVSGVDWLRVQTYLNWQRFLSTFTKKGDSHAGARDNMAWGYTEEGFAYEPQDELMRLRGLNIARQENGNVLINALVIFGVDVLDKESLAEGIARGEKELDYIIPYLRKNFPGFKKAELADVADKLYVRESRHILGEYRLTINDVLDNRDFPDRIAIGSYPVDIQASPTQRWGNVIGSPDRYSIPFRSLVPLDVDNLLVVGRSASFDSLAAGSARVIPIGMSTAEAAGLAAAFSLQEGLDFRTIAYSAPDIQRIQEKLIAQGAYLEPFEIIEPLQEHWAYEGVSILRTLGLVEGGYSNNYRLEEPITKWRMQNTLNGVLRHAGYPFEPFLTVHDEPKTDEILRITAIGVVGGRVADPPTAYNILKEKEILTPELEPFFADMTKRPDTAAVFVLLANSYEYLKAHGQ